MQGKEYWPALQKMGFNYQTLGALCRDLGGAQAVWQADKEILGKLVWLDPMKIDMFMEKRRAIDPEKEWSKVSKKGFKLVAIDDEDYPELLRDIFNPPTVIYVSGDLPVQKTAIAIVGSRKPTPYGLKAAGMLAEELAEAGVVVVSGMARGIDTAGHQGALRVEQGTTIAVLGSGLDIIYPPENKELYHKICRQGAVISEFSPGTPPDSKNFPQRNRIISGLSLGTVVVEAAEKSGSLITADLAVEQGREVFAVPGPITSSQSIGSNRLIKQGAALIQSANDIIEEFKFQPLFNIEEKQKLNFVLSSEEKAIFDKISWEAISFEQLVSNVGLTAAQVNSAVTFLELKGLISQIPGKRYVRI